MSLDIYFHTLRHLKLAQFWNRAFRRFTRITIDSTKLSQSHLSTQRWVDCNLLPTRQLSLGEIQFLNKNGRLNSSSVWNDSTQDRLWLYNLHYFDDLAAVDAKRRKEWHCELIQRWIDENPPVSGVGWEPYPTSLRVVNWIKWILNGNQPDQTWLDNMALQLHVLSQQLEYHLLGNHLFANAKALVFGGLFFEGELAEKWLKSGLKILDRELPEQILEDGAHFELSPMYHGIILQDMLDLVNLTDVYHHPMLGGRVETWRSTSARMLIWMDAMVHPDGKIAFFNDAAFGISPTPAKLRQYASLLGIEGKPLFEQGAANATSVLDLQASGYVRVEGVDSVAILDCAAIGPDYIPGHAHADSLSFELSIGKQRVLVNSGVSEYGLSDERHRQRSTAAHNTVVVDGINSSEVWAGFRVARRARIVEREVRFKEDREVCAAHNGFAKQGHKVLHRRTWKFGESFMSVTDELVGNFQSAVGYLHLHPDVLVVLVSEHSIDLQSATHQIKLEFDGARAEVCQGTWHPEFGLSIPNQHIRLVFTEPKLQSLIRWQVLD